MTMTDPSCWDNRDEIIRAELEPGEQLLWAGRPRKGLLMRKHDVISLVFSFALVVVPSIGFIVDAGKGMPINWDLVGWVSTCWLTVFGVVIARLIMDTRHRAAMVYAVTSQR